MKDPFTITYDRIVQELRDAKLKVISWNAERQPKPDTPQESDLSSVSMIPSTSVINLGNASCGTDVVRGYTFLIETGDMRLGQRAHPAEWRLLGACWNLKFGALDGLLFRNRKFITDVNIAGANMDLEAIGQSGIAGWMPSWTVNVHMQFVRDDLVEAIK